MKADSSQILSPFSPCNKSNRTVLTVGVVTFIYFHSNHGNEACYGDQENDTRMSPKNLGTSNYATNENHSSNCCAHFSAWQADTLYRAKRLGVPSCGRVSEREWFL
jgi:hypothetical protein